MYKLLVLPLQMIAILKLWREQMADDVRQLLQKVDAG
jgi:hypothetical protein